MATVVIRQLTTILLLGAASVSIARPDGSAKTAVLAEGPREASASELGVGRLVADFTIKPVVGKSFPLSQAKPKGALVIAFTSTSCPVANRYAPTLAAIEKQVESQGVKFIFVDPVETDSTADAKQAIQTHGFRGPYVRDASGQVAKALGARTTTEVFVLDAARTLVYRGAVDDQYGLGYSLDAPRHTYLQPNWTSRPGTRTTRRADFCRCPSMPS
jgi:peroxiredoxin